MSAPLVRYGTAGGSGLIDPDTFCGKSADLDTEAIRGSATHLRELGTTLVMRTDSIASVWNGLVTAYVAPESDQVLGLMGPVRAGAGSIDDAYATVARALDRYADELDAIRPRLADFERRASAFRDEIRAAGGMVATSLAGENDLEWWSGTITMAASVLDMATEGTQMVPWYNHRPTSDQNTALWREFADFVEQVSASVATCVYAINTCIDSPVGKVSYEAIPAEAIMSGAIAYWGGPRAEERGCVEQVNDGSVEFTTGLAQGVGGLLLGYDATTGAFAWDPATGEISLRGYGQAWGGLGNLVTAVLLVPTAGIVSNGMLLTGRRNSFTDFMTDRSILLRDVGASLIGFDPYASDGDGWHLWREEGWKQGTLATANVATFFIPGAGGIGAGVKGARAAQVARVAGAAADMVADGGSWAVKGALAASRGAGALARGQGWAAAMEAARFTTGGVRMSATGGIAANSIQAIHDLTKVDAPTIVHPVNMPKVTDSLAAPGRTSGSGMGGGVPGVHLTDNAIRQGMDSWVNKGSVLDVIDRAPVRLPDPDLVPGGARPGQGTDGGNGGGSQPGDGAGTPGGPPAVVSHPLPDIADLKHLKAAGRIAEWAQAVANRHPTLTADEVTAIYEYTTGPGDGGSTNFHEMNTYLRDPSQFSPSQGAFLQSRIDLAASGMSKLESLPGRQFRGTDFPQHVLDDWRVGETVSDPAFVSSSIDEDVATRFRGGGNAFIEMKGLSGVDVNPLSRYEGSEMEVLFRPGVQFAVLERNWVPEIGGGYWKILVEEVVP